jgi:hypothetical protein
VRCASSQRRRPIRRWPNGCERQERVIEHGLGRLRADLRRLHAGGAYTALGYSTWAAEWDDEFRDMIRAVLLEPELECV